MCAEGGEFGCGLHGGVDGSSRVVACNVVRDAANGGDSDAVVWG